MSNTVIHAQGLSKSYIIGHQKQDRYLTLRDEMANGARQWWSRLRNPQYITHDETEEFWALKDVNFAVQSGEKIGIIGRNGAGKSTLLKILSRITSPNSGRVKIRGRVASLLEVGTGFHPELTGRENIFLNGAILGMSRRDIRNRFDEIVDFAEVEKFLDTPVKRYSSGMHVRLAFAVAAHLEPEILIVDEVLAVGDAKFQRKCSGKMGEVGDQGRTILLVSHNMALISNLCQKGIVLNDGSVSFQGPVSEATAIYYKNSMGVGESPGRRLEGEVASLLGAELLGPGESREITLHDELIVRMRYRIKTKIDGICVPNFHFFASDGSCAFVSNADGVSVMSPGDYYAECKLPRDLLNEGAYFVGVALTTYYTTETLSVEFFDRNALTFNVIDPMDEQSNRYSYRGPILGVVRPKLKWNIYREKQ